MASPWDRHPVRRSGRNWSSTDREVARERILLAHDRPLPVDLRAILDGIGATALALERVDLARVVDEARNERRFRALVKYSSDLISLLGTDLLITYQSEAVGEDPGPAAPGDLGKSLGDVVHPDDVAVARSHLAKIFSGGMGATSTVELAWRTATDSGGSSASR